MCNVVLRRGVIFLDVAKMFEDKGFELMTLRMRQLDINETDVVDRLEIGRSLV